mgnify:CR=1 FL=1
MSNNSTLGSFDSPLSPDDAMTDFLTGGGKASNTDEGYRNLPLTEKIRIQIKEAADAHRPWSTQAHEAQRFVAGHQWEEDQVRQLQELGKPKITYNYIAPLINGLVGYESQNRQQMLFTPRLPEHLLSEQYDVSAADAVDTASAGVRWAMARCHGNHERSLVFRDLAVTGMGWASHSMEYEDDLDGKYVYERIPGDQMLWDPRSRKQNLEDAAWVARVSAYHIDEIEERWGKKKRQEVGSLAICTGLQPSSITARTSTTLEHKRSTPRHALRWDHRRAISPSSITSGANAIRSRGSSSTMRTRPF